MTTVFGSFPDPSNYTFIPPTIGAGSDSASGAGQESKDPVTPDISLYNNSLLNLFLPKPEPSPQPPISPSLLLITDPGKDWIA